MRSLLFLLLLTAALPLFSQQRKHEVNLIPDLANVDSQVVVKRWHLLGPFISDFPSMTQLDAFRPYDGERFAGKFVKLQGKGKNAVNAYVKKNSSIFNFGDTSSFTIELKIRLNPGAIFKFPSVLSKRESFEPGKPGWCIFIENSMWQVNFGQVNKLNFQVAGSTINDGAWHTLTVKCLFKNGNRFISTFTDGKLINREVMPEGFGNLNSSAPLVLGYIKGGNSDKMPLDAYVCDLKIWKFAISDEYISKHFLDHGVLPTMPFYKKLIGFWKCNDGLGDEFKDFTANSNNFIIEGKPIWIEKNYPLSPPKNKINFIADNANFIQTTDYIDLRGFYECDIKAIAYAKSSLVSEISQDVAFLIGFEDHIKIWLNSKLIYQSASPSQIKKNEVIIGTHLEKGENNLLVECANIDKNWGFTIDLSSKKYVNKNSLGFNYQSISDRYLLTERDSLSLRLKYPAFSFVKPEAKIIIKTVSDSTIFQGSFDPQKTFGFPSKIKNHEIYKCEITTDINSFEQVFVVGDYTKIFEGLLKKGGSLCFSDEDRITLNSFQIRFTDLVEYGKKNSFDESTQRKISQVFYFVKKFILEKENNKTLKGFYLNSLRSGIDSLSDNYMAYIPKSYSRERPIPIVVMVPYVTYTTPFLKSYHVSPIGRLEYLCQLADKYGYGIVWPSSRIMNDYNLNTIVASATFEVLENVSKKYSIDHNKIYLYGDCSGGMQALLLAGRYPGKFAAVAVEGPELSYTNCAATDCDIPKEWIAKNNIFGFIDNFLNTSVYIKHSVNDQKADITLSERLFKEIKSLGGQAKFDKFYSLKDNKSKFIVENPIMGDFFAYFKDKSVNNQKINLSTFQLKYGKNQWIKIDNIVSGRKGIVSGTVDALNQVHIISKNVNQLTVFNAKFAKPGVKIKVFLNDRVVYDGIPKADSISINDNNFLRVLSAKSDKVEGPISDIFAESFIIVKGENSTQDGKRYRNISDSLAADWYNDYLAKCKVREVSNLSKFEMESNNLIFVGDRKTNKYIDAVMKQMKMQLTENYIQIGERKYEGSQLSVNMICPNPFNKQKYILLITSNCGKILPEQIKKLSFKGFNDIEIWDVDQESCIETDDFDNDWH